MRTVIVRGAYIPMLALGASLLMPAQTRAQEMYDTSVPAVGDILKEPPTTMHISFSEGIHLTEVRLVSVDNGREIWPIEWPKTNEDVFKVEIAVTKPLPPGKYQLEWLADVRQHYHSDGGVIPFTVTSQDLQQPSNPVMPVAVPPEDAAPSDVR
ncbi:copper resistance CopC family protein [Hyphomicrobium facile]|uniref:Copper-binding protein CopC (Methionine-rich) n=1 Tax=Hyphomicrobium facile TaxID=51670 RepID=A0A1I7N4I9_9HYPH|nr:copper resistance protein CopC [Hyphomicrobium facile]SFV29560.1 Copper-binding protein CopC (methionine-rich) [Hyphomicrobium facile]